MSDPQMLDHSPARMSLSTQLALPTGYGGCKVSTQLVIEMLGCVVLQQQVLVKKRIAAQFTFMHPFPLPLPPPPQLSTYWLGTKLLLQTGQLCLAAVGQHQAVGNGAVQHELLVVGEYLLTKLTAASCCKLWLQDSCQLLAVMLQCVVPH